MIAVAFWVPLLLLVFPHILNQNTVFTLQKKLVIYRRLKSLPYVKTATDVKRQHFFSGSG